MVLCQITNLSIPAQSFLWVNRRYTHTQTLVLLGILRHFCCLLFFVLCFIKRSNSTNLHTYTVLYIKSHFVQLSKQTNVLLEYMYTHTHTHTPTHTHTYISPGVPRYIGCTHQSLQCVLCVWRQTVINWEHPRGTSSD